jgi:L-fuconolactonase
MRVDAHQHFWQYTAEKYGWIDVSMAAIRRDFLPANLKPLLDAAGVDATVAVQARQSLEETRWLLNLARENAWIAGVVGWAPLAEERVDVVLEELAADERLKGVRHVLQAEPDAYFARADFNAGVGLLRKRSLVYDVLIVERQLPAAIALVDRHPTQQFVLDHVAKPLIAADVFEPWATQMRELAKRPHVVCKLSGMVTEASFHHWTADNLRPYLETALDAFGPERLMFGSDWPVCTVAANYTRWMEVVRDFIGELSGGEQRGILGGNAVRVYRLNESVSAAE